MSGFDPYGNFGGSSGGHLDGGGFDNHNNNNSNSTSQNFNDKPVYQKQFISPVTIKMINDAQLQLDGSFSTHNINLNYIRFIGVIRNIDNQNDTHTIYKLEDGTGDTTIRIWHNDDDDDNNNNNLNNNHNDNDNDGFDNDDDANAAFGDDNNSNNNSGFKKPKFSSNDYVECVATIREFNSKIQLYCQKISKINDFNQISYHLLNVAYNYLNHKNGNNSSLKNNNQSDSNLFVDENNNNNQQQQNNQSNKSLSERLYDFITEHSKTMSDGVPMKFMAQEFDMGIQEIEKGITSLVEEGRIFTTTDDDQFLPL
ncbi:hypothetical protein C6P40_004017 [Pichia californica]|uniref:Replication protein A C-terminal domain-containing protein n=1 Tax=Pichia californica TaxID=460514 RepID=A0A9P7BHY9_9ASCO|nr:hypothetical protein C6P42_002445 [[Candida] californica]KAG0691205.1 hypothetical protein C6P40_004017 [[Candida] californica]